MFSKIFYAALVAGVSAIPQPESPQGYGNAPAGYGQESYNATSVDAAKPSSFTTSSYAEPPAYSAPASSSTPYSPTTPVAPGYGDYSSSSSSTPYDPVSTSSTPVAPGYGDYSSSSSSSTPYNPVSSSKSEDAPPTYGTGKPYSSSSSTEGSPYPPSSKPVYGTGSSSKPVGPTGTGSYPSKSTDELTTITLTNTKTITVTKDHQTYTTTTEEVKTTECPKSEASKLTKTYPASSSTEYSPEKPSSSSEKIPYYPESSKSKPYGPISTGVPSYPSKSVPTGYDTTSEVVYNQTLTYTLGHGSSTTVVTTTVKSTSTLYLTSTVYATKSYATKSESEAKPTGYPDKATKYTTVQSTSTITNTITVYPQPSGKPSGTEGSPNGGASTPVKNTYECKPTTVTVTEKETIYVTLPASKSDVKTEGPKQSSTAVYYPTKSYGSESSGHAKPTGFHTSYTKSAVPSYPVKSDKSSSTEYSPEKPTTSKGTAPVAYPTKSSSTEYSPEKPTAPVYSKSSSTTEYSPEKPTAPGYSKPSSSSSTEYSPEKPTTESKPIYSYAPSSSSSTEHAPVSTAYVTPVPSKPAGYEAPAGYN